MRAELVKRLVVKRPGVRARGDMIGIPLPNILDRWACKRAARRRHSGKGRAVPVRCPSIFLADQSGGIIMNTAVARRLALGDRVVWVGKNDYSPGGPGTITRITAHQVQVLWEDETARRYRRAQLHNLRHVKLISAAADPRCEPHNCLESASFV